MALINAIRRYLNEKEIDDLLTTLIERESVLSSGEDASIIMASVIRELVKTRHFSEDFILKYYKYLNKRDILELHSPDIANQSYPQLTLLLMNDDEKK